MTRKEKYQKIKKLYNDDLRVLGVYSKRGPKDQSLIAEKDFFLELIKLYRKQKLPLDQIQQNDVDDFLSLIEKPGVKSQGRLGFVNSDYLLKRIDTQLEATIEGESTLRSSTKIMYQAMKEVFGLNRDLNILEIDRYRHVFLKTNKAELVLSWLIFELSRLFVKNKKVQWNELASLLRVKKYKNLSFNLNNDGFQNQLRSRANRWKEACKKLKISPSRL